MFFEGRGGQLARGGLLHPDHHPLHHHGLLHGANRQPSPEEDGGRQDEASASRLPGVLGHGGLLHLLPALHHRQDGAADSACAGGQRTHPEQGHVGLRRPHGPLIHGLPAGPAGLLLLQHQVQGYLSHLLLPLLGQRHPGATVQLDWEHDATNTKQRHLRFKS